MGAARIGESESALSSSAGMIPKVIKEASPGFLLLLKEKGGEHPRVRRLPRSRA